MTKTLTILLLAYSPALLNAWGFLCHQHINHQAVFCLPSEMFGFYKRHIVYITEKAVNPDKRRYIMDNEAPKHYLDIDYYSDSMFIKGMPSWTKALKSYHEDTLIKHGTLPWNILLIKKQLTDAFIDKDVDRILKLSADVGHYLGDANVPLHTTKNYNGQLTNQVGIHGLWETRIPELHIEEFKYWNIKAQYINDWNTHIWNTILRSHSLVDSVLSTEKELSLTFPYDKKYSLDTKGRAQVKTYSREYTAAYHKKLNGMVHRQMRHSVQNVAEFWYSCWIDAGQPSLDNLIKADISSEDKETEMESKETVPDKSHKDCEGHH